MTCQRCEDQATVHLTETVNGRRREVHLCAGCARKAGVLPDESSAAPPGFEAVVQGLAKDERIIVDSEAHLHVSRFAGAVVGDVDFETDRFIHRRERAGRRH